MAASAEGWPHRPLRARYGLGASGELGRPALAVLPRALLCATVAPDVHRLAARDARGRPRRGATAGRGGTHLGRVRVRARVRVRVWAWARVRVGVGVGVRVGVGVGVRVRIRAGDWVRVRVSARARGAA